MSGKFGKGAALALGVGLAVAAGGALAHNTAGEHPTTAGGKAALARHDNFEKMGGAFKKLNDELKKDNPDKAVIAQNAAIVRQMSTQLPTWFPRGSGQEARPKSEAKANIWTDAAGFSAAAANMQVQVSKLNQLAAAGDIAGVKAQARATGGSCKGCHDKFRVEKKT